MTPGFAGDTMREAAVSDQSATAMAVRVVTLPLFGVLAAVAVLRDHAAALRLREPDITPKFPARWDRLTAGQRAMLLPTDDTARL